MHQRMQIVCMHIVYILRGTLSDGTVTARKKCRQERLDILCWCLKETSTLYDAIHTDYILSIVYDHNNSALIKTSF